MALTKQDLKDIGDVIDLRLKSGIHPLELKVDLIQKDIVGLREQIQQLTITLDNFVKMMTDYKEEFAILKAKVDQMKRVMKEKFGIEIAVQRS